MRIHGLKVSSAARSVMRCPSWPVPVYSLIGVRAEEAFRSGKLQFQTVKAVAERCNIDFYGKTAVDSVNRVKQF